MGVQRPRWSERGRWLALAVVPSSLLLSVTTYVTTDLLALPLLWVIPLALYLGTFILAFSRRQLLPRGGCSGCSLCCWCRWRRRCS